MSHPARNNSQAGRASKPSSQAAHQSDRSFYPKPSKEQPMDISIEDFVSPIQLSGSNAKMQPQLEAEVESKLIEVAMADHPKMMNFMK